MNIHTYIIDCWYRMNIQSSKQNNYIKLFILILSFWLSGIIILSTVFTLTDQLQSLTLWMFLTLSIGSFIGGVMADFYGRKPVFHICVIIVFIGSFLILINPYFGYIISAVAIGPMNSITFVLILQGLQGYKDFYTTLVLIGWASSQICLGLFFLFQLNQKLLYMIIFLSALILLISSILFINETLTKSQRIPFKFKNIIPRQIKPLIAGCILMFAIQMFYYRTQFTLDKFGISAQVNTIVVGITQVLSNILFSKFIANLHRKRSLQILFFLLIGLFILLLIFESKYIQTIVQGVMRIINTGIMLILGVYLPELFSMKQRGRGTNFVMSFGVIGSALSQYMLNNFPFYFLLFFIIIAEIATFFMRQTVNNYQIRQRSQEEVIMNQIQN